MLRFEPEIASLIRRKARLAKKSVNKYFLSLAIKDLQAMQDFPKVTLPEHVDEDLAIMAGNGKNAPSKEDLANDERLAAIWNR